MEMVVFMLKHILRVLPPLAPCLTLLSAPISRHNEM